jgi:hypothetical protein
MGRQIVYSLSLEVDFSRSGVFQTADGAQGGRFTGSVRPNKRNDFTIIYVY